MSQIVIDCTPALFPTNGIGRVTTELLKAMIKRKENTELLLYTRSITKKLAFFPNCETLRLRFPKVFEGLIHKYRMIERMAPKADIYHATNHYMPTKTPQRTIVTVHDLIFLKSPETHLQSIHNEMAQKAPAYIKEARHIITCSEYTKNDLTDYLGVAKDKISVIHWGLNHRLFKPLENKDQTSISLAKQFGITKPYFLGVSCSVGRKNTPMLLSAYKKILKKHPKNDLVLVWDAPEEIRKKYNHPRIHFTGKVSDDTLKDLYGCATATVYPSLYEGFGLPVLESMSCGTPVICSNVTSLPEVGGDVALYMDPLDQGSLITQMMKFENDSLDLKQLKSEGIKRATQYTWDKCAQKTLAIYKRFQS
jgi:glycosyltransferase involved in cell wall biosynthesis